MKKIKDVLKAISLLLLFLFSANELSAKDAKKFWTTPSPKNTLSSVDYVETLDDAIDKGIEQNKPIMVFAKIQGCPKCAYMENVALKDKAVVDFINQHFVVVQIEKGDADLNNDLSPPVFPTIFIVDDNKKVVGDAHYGISNNIAFMRYLQRVVSKIDKGVEPMSKEELEAFYGGGN